MTWDDTGRLSDSLVRDAEAASSNLVASIFLCPAGDPAFMRISGRFHYVNKTPFFRIFGLKMPNDKKTIKNLRSNEKVTSGRRLQNGREADFEE